MSRVREASPLGWENMPVAFEVVLEHDGAGWVVEFPGLEGCRADGRSRDEALRNAQEALSGWLWVELRQGRALPSPRPARRGAVVVTPDLDVQVSLALLWARRRRGLTQRQVAAALGVTQQAYAKLERPGAANVTVKLLARVAAVLGLAVAWRAAA